MPSHGYKQSLRPDRIQGRTLPQRCVYGGQHKVYFFSLLTSRARLTVPIDEKLIATGGQRR